MPRHRAARSGRLTPAELSAIKLSSSFDYISKLGDDFARIQLKIDAGRRALKRSKAKRAA